MQSLNRYGFSFHNDFYEIVKNLDKAKKGEIATLSALNHLSAGKRAPPRHPFLRNLSSFFPIALLRETKRDIGKIKRDIGQNKREIISTKRGIISTERALVFAKRNKISKKIAKKSSRGALFSHLKAGVARSKKSPQKTSRR